MQQSQDGTPQANQRPTVLLVDDERDFVDTLSKRLAARDFPVSVAYGGEEALEIAARDGCDIMILDLKMPGIDGIEVLQRLKKRRQEVEVIILTGHGAAQEERAARAIGAFDYLHKPADINTLIDAMQRAYATLLKSRGVF